MVTIDSTSQRAGMCALAGPVKAGRSTATGLGRTLATVDAQQPAPLTSGAQISPNIHQCPPSPRSLRTPGQ